MATSALGDRTFDAAPVKAQDPFGVVTVTVGESGTLQHLDIAEDAYAHYTPAQLSAAIESTYHEAREKLRREVISHFYQLCGVDVSAEASQNSSRLHDLIGKLASRPALKADVTM